MRWIALTLAITAAAPALADGAGMAELAGAWTAVQAEQEGAPAPALVGHRLAFQGDRYAISGADGTPLFAGTYRLDPGGDPLAIDFQGKTAQGAEASWEGVYRLDGDTLTIVDDAPDPSKGRPTGLEAPSGSGHVLIEFRRSR